MPMLNKDLLKKNNEALMKKLSSALQEENVEEAAKAMQEMQDAIADAVEAEFQQYKDVTDMNILQQRGLRMLTTEETNWYQKFIGAVKDGAKQQIEKLNDAMPVTIISRVIEDMRAAHPLLQYIPLQDAAGAVRLVMNAIQMAAKMGKWGPITSGFAQELAGKLKTEDVTRAKYTAFFAIPKDFTKFNFGFAPMWVDQYIRILLSESSAYGLEETIIKGNGKDQFIGMIMNLATNAEGVYSAKNKVKITNFEDDYRDVVAGMAKDDEGNDREIPKVLMIVNPQDYIKKIRPWQNCLIYGMGNVDMIDHTYPTDVVTSSKLAEGEAVAGIAKNYFAAINGGTSGIIEYDDSVQFLEDNRVYTTRIYGGGRPVDNKSFTYLDISDLKAPALPVFIQGGVLTTVNPAADPEEE